MNYIGRSAFVTSVRNIG